jgi:hypothetical protein
VIVGWRGHFGIDMEGESVGERSRFQAKYSLSKEALYCRLCNCCEGLDIGKS